MNKPDFYRYIALLDYEKDSVHVTFPDLPGCVTFGQDEEEAIKEAREVLKLHLWGMEDDGDTPPEPSTIKNLSSSQKLKDNETFFLVDAFMPPIHERMAKRFVKTPCPYQLGSIVRQKAMASIFPRPCKRL